MPALKTAELVAIGVGVRTCRLCGCTDARACPGGCAWALEDVCTACLGHTPASWALLRRDGVDAILDGGGRPKLVCLLSAAAHATYALDQIAGHAAEHRQAEDDEVAREALAAFLLAADDVLDALQDPALTLLQTLLKRHFEEEGRTDAATV